jgi:type II secretory pathway pseudopilin PulG
MSLELVLIVALAVVAALVAGVLWLSRDLISLAREAVETNTRTSDDALEAARLSAATVQAISTDHLAAIDATNESHRTLAVDLITTALIGPTTTTDDRPEDDRPDGTEPPEAIIVDTDLEDPSDVWMPDKALEAIAFPPPINEVPVEGLNRSGIVGQT